MIDSLMDSTTGTSNAEQKSSSDTVEETGQMTATSTYYLNFSFFKVDSKWRWLNEIGKDEAAKEFANLIEVANTKMKVRTYTTLGIRADTDFMLWMISDSVEKMQILTSKIYSTVLG
ncbi:MAG: chlorite dismutase family protein, partial [Thermoproteota archaeon]|nr:chlorite dismutase family protein [Thermoproteota archaeon]